MQRSVATVFPILLLLSLTTFAPTAAYAQASACQTWLATGGGEALILTGSGDIYKGGREVGGGTIGVGNWRPAANIFLDSGASPRVLVGLASPGANAFVALAEDGTPFTFGFGELGWNQGENIFAATQRDSLADRFVTIATVPNEANFSQTVYALTERADVYGLAGSWLFLGNVFDNFPVDVVRATWGRIKAERR